MGCFATRARRALPEWAVSASHTLPTRRVETPWTPIAGAVSAVPVPPGGGAIRTGRPAARSQNLRGERSREACARANRLRMRTRAFVLSSRSVWRPPLLWRFTVATSLRSASPPTPGGPQGRTSHTSAAPRPSLSSFVNTCPKSHLRPASGWTGRRATIAKMHASEIRSGSPFRGS